MSEAKKGGGRSKAAAAKEENQKAPKSVDFRGLELVLPAKIPGSVLFDLAEIDLGKDFGGTMGMLRSIIGDGPYEAVKFKVKQDGLDFEDALTEISALLEEILEKSGLSSGE